MALQKSRKIWLSVHKWLGLVLGIFFVLQGLTGSANVFYRELDYMANGWLWEADSTQPWLSLDVLARAAASRCDDGLEGDVRLEFPYRQDQAPMFICEVGGSDAFVTVDPKTAEVLGIRDDPGSLQYIIYYLHSELLLGEDGKFLLLVLAVALLTSTLTGLYLWWPRAGKWRWGFRMRRNASGFLFWFDLHRVGGIYAVLVLFIAALTGLYQVVSPAVHDSIESTLGARFPAAYEMPEIAVTESAPTISWQSILDTAKAEFPEAAMAEIQYPMDRRDAILVVTRQPGERRVHGGDSVLWLHPQSGKVVGKFDSATDAGAGDRVLLSLFSFHTGQEFGLVHRWLVFFGGLTPALLFVSGFVVWRYKVRQKAGVKQRKKNNASPDSPSRRVQTTKAGDMP
ncbi:MAG TPA: PepSY-associated TM helix domain-containing protein [Woeseiaceae bacterium]|nr:PepSY-associated TM helix domain-containing protein [Woeseiaceae bacterium]